MIEQGVGCSGQIQVSSEDGIKYSGDTKMSRENASEL